MIYDKIIDGNIKESLEKVCEILYLKTSIEELENDLILVCNYIGKNMNINHTKKWGELIELTYKFIENDKVEVDNTLILITKMCLICKTIQENKKIGIAQLKNRLSKQFDEKLTSLEENKYEIILPSMSSECYEIASKITKCFHNLIDELNRTSTTDKDMIHIINRLRLSIEYICRKNIWIETHLHTDTDVIWFLWGLLRILSNDDITIYNSFQLFILKWKNSNKNNRIGILWGSVFLLILYFKSDLSFYWKSADERLFDNIKTMAGTMMLKIKEKFPKKEELKIEIKDIDFISRYIPKIKDMPVNSSYSNNIENEQKKNILL